MGLSAALLELGVLNIVGIFGIVMIGLPHGALDGAVAMHIGLVKKLSNLIKFMLAYISLAVFVVIVWMFFPAFSLIAFLGISLLHFGYGDAKNGEGITKFAEAVAHGGLVIVGISQFHRGEVDEIFYYLIKQDTSTIWLGMNIASIGVIAAIATCLLQTSKDVKWSSTTLELLLVGVVIAIAPPLLGFSIYFCLIHSARHFSRIYRMIKQNVANTTIKTQAILFTLACWLAAVVAFVLFADFSNPGPTILRIIFIGLAALTVPHMILIDGLLNDKNKINSTVQA